MIKLVINSISTAPGGGLTNLLGLLEGWAEIGADLDPIVIASRPETLRALQYEGHSNLVHSVDSKGLSGRLVWEHRYLPKIVAKYDAALLMSNNFAAPHVACPQIVHHQNLFFWSTRTPSGDLRRKPRRRLQRAIAHTSIVRASANVFISEYLRGCAEARVPSSTPKNHVIYYGLSKAFLQRIQSYRSDTPPTYHLCAIQNPSDYKDNKTLLTAFSMLCRDRPRFPWRLSIVGGGPWTRWQRFAAALGISTQIDWHGMLRTHQVAELLHKCDGLLHPSVFEGFGIPIIEAMATGCPVIAVATGAIPEVSQGGAILVPPQSPHALVRAINRLYDDRALRERKVQIGLEHARNFSWAKTAQAFVNVFEQVLD